MIKQLYAAGLKKKKDQLSAFKHFINEFGTHYAAATELGTKLTIERRYSAKVTRTENMCKYASIISMQCSRRGPAQTRARYLNAPLWPDQKYLGSRLKWRDTTALKIPSWMKVGHTYRIWKFITPLNYVATFQNNSTKGIIIFLSRDSHAHVSS